MKPEETLPTIVRTLLSLGFQIIHSSRKPAYMALCIARLDELGVENRYVLACCETDYRLSEGDIQSLRRLAEQERAAPVVLGAAENSPTGIPVMTIDNFLARLGGPVSALLPLEPDFPEQLRILGNNALPPGLAGKPDTIFEEYVHAGLQFLLQDRVVRYGQERRFEALPDGLVPGRRSPLMLYDAKAAAGGYHVTIATIRQFADYVRKFHDRYENYVDRLFSFLVISGQFSSDETLQDRSDQLYAECGVRLAFMPADEMAAIIAILADRPVYRSAIDWKEIFSKTTVTADLVRKSIEARRRDGVIHGS